MTERIRSVIEKELIERYSNFNTSQFDRFKHELGDMIVKKKIQDLNRLYLLLKRNKSVDLLQEVIYKCIQDARKRIDFQQEDSQVK